MDIVNKLRVQAQKLKTNKHEIARKFLLGADAGVKSYGLGITVVEKTVVAYRAGHQILCTIFSTESYRTQGSLIIANVAHDFGSRLNEVANLVESVRKERSVQEAVERSNAAIAEMAAAIKTYQENTPDKTLKNDGEKPRPRFRIFKGRD